MFKVKFRKTKEILQVLDSYCDEYGKTWFLFWLNDGWRWRPADDFVPPNYTIKYKVIIAGSRSFNNYLKVAEVLDEYKDEIGEVVCGEAKGADILGKTWAIKNGVPVKSFPADWQTHGSAAGFIRNKQMGDYADILVAFWDGQSVGTKDMIEYMKKLDKQVIVVTIT